MGCLWVPGNHELVGPHLFKIIWLLFANETNQGTTQWEVLGRGQFFRNKTKHTGDKLTLNTYLHARVPALRSQAGKEGHGWDQNPSQADGRHHPGIFCGQKWPCESMCNRNHLPGQPPRHCLLSLARCPTATTVFKAALAYGARKEVRVASLAFWTFVSLIFMSPF